MKRYFLLCLFIAVAALQISFAQEFNFTGEMKTGVYWETRRIGDEGPKEIMELGNSDGDSGGFNPTTGMTNIPGRFRLNLEFKPIPSIGFRVRFEDSAFTGLKVSWAYSYAYGNFLNDQLKISAGKLGDSPWKTGGPELNTSIDETYVNSFAGLRVEYKPESVPGLNVGFVLSPPNYNLNRGDEGFVSFISETVIGAAYTHNLFAVRFSWRFDGVDADNYQDADGHSMVYRLEEKILNRYVPGLSISANGIWEGLVDGFDRKLNLQNWLYIVFKEYNIDSEVRVGYQAAYKEDGVIHRHMLQIKPFFSYWFTPMISAGIRFVFAKDFGDLSQVDYDNFTVEPQVKVTFNPNAYVAFVYGYQQMPRVGYMEEAYYINLRLVYSF
ncbi:MAG: hypothetical protein LBC52_06705 [Treponema sp.]|jgi:hypothetical protein|nr:hypothetical protein [Treponema sp.]